MARANILKSAPVTGGRRPRVEDILETLERNHPGSDAILVRRAYIFAASAHKGMLRHSGEPYLIHPLAVASILGDLKADAVGVAAGLLHDTVEDTPATVEEITARFGKEVALIVDGVTKIGKMNFSSATERKAGNMRKLVLAMLADPRVTLVKLADRLHNMRTLDFMTADKQAAISLETMKVFVPLASGAGLQEIQMELESLCRHYLEPTAGPGPRRNIPLGRNDRPGYAREAAGR